MTRWNVPPSEKEGIFLGFMYVMATCEEASTKFLGAYTSFVRFHMIVPPSQNSGYATAVVILETERTALHSEVCSIVVGT